MAAIAATTGWTLAWILYARGLGWSKSGYVAAGILATNSTVIGLAPLRQISRTNAMWFSFVAAVVLLVVTKGRPWEAMDPDSIPGQNDAEGAPTPERTRKLQVTIIIVLLILSVPLYIISSH